jgi:hypothetical protein
MGKVLCIQPIIHTLLMLRCTGGRWFTPAFAVVNQYSRSHHPLDACYNLVVGEPLDRQIFYWDEFRITIIIFIFIFYFFKE